MFLVPDRGHAEVDASPVLETSVDLGELVLGSRKADTKSFDFAEPAFTFGFGDAGEEIVADLDEAVSLGRVGPEHRAADAGFSELAIARANGREGRS
jgi:hypothetical protein